MKTALILSAALVATASAASGKVYRAVQLDVARQRENVSFISNYIDRVSAFGVNTLELYLEGRVATRAFALPPDESYSENEIRGIVAHAAEKGVEVVPVVSLLGHAEHFFKYPGREELSEEHLGGNTFGGNGKTTFCLSNPKTREFLRRYIGEVAALFPSKNFHAGFDESWNMGRCPLCRPKTAADGGDELFLEFVRFAHDLLAGLGKRMWMWDDFFAFHMSALDVAPKDIMLLHWNYATDISSRGARVNFGGHERRDWLDDYAALGYESLVVCWHEPENLRTLWDYARKHRAAGWVVGQWEEKFDRFHGAGLVKVLAANLLFDEPAKWQLEDPFREAARRLFPSLTDTEVDAVAAVVRAMPFASSPATIASAASRGLPSPAAPALRLAADVLSASALRPSEGAVAEDPLSERGLLDDLLLDARAGLLEDVARRAVKELGDPARTAADVAAAKALVRSHRAEAEAVAARRREQDGLWRKGVKAISARTAESFLAFAAEVEALEEAPAPKDEKRLDLCLTLVDYWGIPRWTVEGFFGGEWRLLGKGAWKPRQGEWAAFHKYLTFKAETMPEKVRVSYTGFGAGELRYLQIEDKDGVVRPSAVLAVKGQVADAAALLTDDFRAARFGDPDAMERVRRSSDPVPPAVVELELR